MSEAGEAEYHASNGPRETPFASSHVMSIAEKNKIVINPIHILIETTVAEAIPCFHGSAFLRNALTGFFSILCDATSLFE